MITNDNLFDLMEILGLIGLDIEIDEDEEKTGFAIIGAILKNSKKAKPQIEKLLGDLTGEDTSKPLGLIKAMGKAKKDEEILDFFKQALTAFQSE